MNNDNLDTARRVCREAFGLDAEATSLAGEFDLNFLLTGTDARHVLKLSPEVRAPVLDLSTQCLAHLQGHALPAGVPVPVSVSDALATRHGPYVAKTTVNGKPFAAAVLTYLPGLPIAGLHHRRGELLNDLGGLLAHLDHALGDFEHEEIDRPLLWRLDDGVDVVTQHLSFVKTEGHDLVARTLERIQLWLGDGAADLPTGVIHNDANDYNVMVTSGRSADARLSGLIDFGDLTRGWRVAEPVVAAAYMAMGLADPVGAACQIAAGYNQQAPLTEAESSLFAPLMALRLCLSVAIQGRQIQEQPNNAYLAVSQEPAWQLLGQLDELDWHAAECRIRAACGRPATSTSKAVLDWIETNRGRMHPVVDEQRLTRPMTVDLSVESLTLPHPEKVSEGADLDRWVEALLTDAGATVGVGQYGEARLVYDDPAFLEAADPVPEARTIHMGFDLFLPAGSSVFSPMDGTVVGVVDNAGNLDYGPTVTLRHDPPGGPTFFTLYGHLNAATLTHLEAGDTVAAGDEIGWLGDRSVNGGWTPHLHLQLITTNGGSPPLSDSQLTTFPGVARPSVFPIWEQWSPNPAGLSGLPAASFTQTATDVSRDQVMLTKRRQLLGPSLSLSYDRPLHIVRGIGTSLYDAQGRRYLDSVNNIAHVGHANRRVVEATLAQATVLNTNTRYLHDNIAVLAEELLATLPDPLEVVYFVCSGSEANELALRMARTATDRRGVVVVEGGYHGNTDALIEISPYKFRGAGGHGPGPHVAVTKSPDPSRDEKSSVGDVASDVEGCFQALEPDGAAAFICESILSCAGQIEPPAGYLEACYTAARQRGALCIADEVQVGFGRVGDAFWGFELQGVVPDIVTMGKPMGNGHPVAAVVTTRKVADAFANGMEYFNSFGGNPVSCAAALAVLAEVKEEGLQENARTVGDFLKQHLHELQRSAPQIGDVRGRGLFLGVELVKDRESLEPATEDAAYIVERMRDRRVLASTDGPHRNVLKIKPPLVFTENDAAELSSALGEALAELS